MPRSPIDKRPVEKQGTVYQETLTNLAQIVNKSRLNLQYKAIAISASVIYFNLL